jgi:L-ascorbate metabolism protein UlaG (beta-lactamase superfamily)
MIFGKETSVKKTPALISCSILTLIFILASCAHQRLPLPEQKRLLDTFIWYPSPNPNGSNSISFQLGGKLIYIDPVLTQETASAVPKADLVLVTHTHLDHFSPGTIATISGGGTQIAGIWNLQKDFSRSIPMRPGESREIEGLTVTTYPAYNASHSRLLNNLAFTVSDGYQTVFISGDTDMQAELKGITGIDVAVYFMYTGSTLPLEDAVKLTKSMRPAAIIPVHWVLGMEDTLAELAKKTGSISLVRVLEKSGK